MNLAPGLDATLAEVRSLLGCDDDRDFPPEPLVALHRANAWIDLSREGPGALRRAPGRLLPSTADAPDFHRRGLGAEFLRHLRRRYEALHMHILVADGRAVEFFERCGLAGAGETQAVRIYAEGEH